MLSYIIICSGDTSVYRRFSEMNLKGFKREKRIICTACFFFKKLHSVWETSGRQREGVGSVLDAGYAYLTHAHTSQQQQKYVSEVMWGYFWWQMGEMKHLLWGTLWHLSYVQNVCMSVLCSFAVLSLSSPVPCLCFYFSGLRAKSCLLLFVPFFLLSAIRTSCLTR